MKIRFEDYRYATASQNQSPVLQVEGSMPLELDLEVQDVMALVNTHSRLFRCKIFPTGLRINSFVLAMYSYVLFKISFWETEACLPRHMIKTCF